MADFKDIYKSKLKTPLEVASFVRSGAVCASDIALSNSAVIYEALSERVRKGELKNVTHHTILDVGHYPFYDPEVAENLRSVSWFTQRNGRKAVNAGLADVMPCYYMDMPELFKDYVKPDTFIAVVSPMDKHGYFSTGTSASNSSALISSAKTILLEVNPHMPRALTSPQIHITQITALCENDAPLITLPKNELDPLSITIGNYIAEEICDGATLQLGIGKIPDAVGLALKDKHHLGIHTEMFTDSMVELIECGAVDNMSKPINTGKSVAAFALGSQKMYDYIDDNPAMQMMTVDYVNDPYVIAQHPNFMSVNAALEVDFYGQVCAESIGTKHISGTGGHRDYVRGAVKSKGGKSFIAFTSTARGDTESKIVPTLKSGSCISTGKNDVDNVVTEYGIARLRGKSLSQRTRELINISHPKFREELLFAARKQNIII